MYQLEVKRYLIESMFNPSNGWEVMVDIDAMERAKGPQQPADKEKKVLEAEEKLKDMGVNFGSHPKYGRVDIVARHPDKGTFIIEVEGESSKQKEQAMYSALGQTIILMKENDERITYGLAVPEQLDWERQLKKVPIRIKKLLFLKCFLVSKENVREI